MKLMNKFVLKIRNQAEKIPEFVICNSALTGRKSWQKVELQND